MPQSKETAPNDPPLKDPKNFTLIGKPQKRLDTPGKVDGSAVYGIDAMLPGMKFATIAASPVLGGKVSKVDDSAAKQIPGVQQVIVLDDMVAVVGDHFWAAKSGLDALKIDMGSRRERDREYRCDLETPARRKREGRRRREIGGRREQGVRIRRSSSTPSTSCRSLRTRRWSR